MRPDWSRLRDETAAVQLRFLDAEVNTGITFARIALNATDRRKVSRNAVNARKAYETITSYAAELSSDTPEIEEIRKKAAILRQLLDQLGEKP